MQGLVQLIRFLVVELNHLDLNSKFDMSVAFTANYTFSGRQCSCRQQCTFGDRLHESQDQNWLSLSDALIGVGCACVFIRVSAVFLKKNCLVIKFLLIYYEFQS
jgi:hypothetical protein